MWLWKGGRVRDNLMCEQERPSRIIISFPMASELLESPGDITKRGAM